MNRCFFEINVTVSSEGCQWEGQGWWEVMPGTTDWAAITAVVSRCVIGAIGSLVGISDYRFDMSGQLFTVQPELAAKIDQHTSRYASDDLRQIVWGLKQVKVVRKTRTVPDGNQG